MIKLRDQLVYPVRIISFYVYELIRVREQPIFFVSQKWRAIAECLSARYWIAECGQRWQQVLYVYTYVRHALECN